MKIFLLLLLNIYLFKKHCHLTCSVYKKSYFLFLHSSIFYSKIHKHPAYKINRDKQGGRKSEWGQKSEVLSEHTF